MNARAERILLVLLLGAVLLLLQSGPSRAQSRPSLEKMQAALCAKADVDGDGYRPIFCPPSCSCNINEPYASGTVCEELTAGDYQVVNPQPYFPECSGVCVGGASAGAACTAAVQCGAGSCAFSYGRCAGGPLNSSLCSVPTDCFGFPCNLDSTARCTEFEPCSSDADCAYVGFSCDAVLGLCTTGPCTGPGSCSAGTKSFLYLSLTNVAAPGALTAADCAGQRINSNDAAACIAAVEGAIGQACAPPP